MQTLLRFALPFVLVLGLIAAPATAQEEPIEEPVEEEEPVYEDITFFFHGTEDIGELEAAGLGHMSMSPDEPTSSSSKSRGVTNYVAGPNTRCSGNWLLPTWDGWLSGTVQNDMTVVLHAMSHPGNQFIVDVFADGGGACNEDYVEPVASQTVELPAGGGELEVVFPNVDFEVWGQLTVMVRPLGTEPSQGRVFYDSTEQPSRIELQCLLDDDKETCL